MILVIVDDLTGGVTPQWINGEV